MYRPSGPRSRLVVVAFLEDLDAVVAKVDDDDVALGRDGDAARAVELAGPGPLAPERADEHPGRGKYLQQSNELSVLKLFCRPVMVQQYLLGKCSFLQSTKHLQFRAKSRMTNLFIPAAKPRRSMGHSDTIGVMEGEVEDFFDEIL